MIRRRALQPAESTHALSRAERPVHLGPYARFWQSGLVAVLVAVAPAAPGQSPGPPPVPLGDPSLRQVPGPPDQRLPVPGFEPAEKPQPLRVPEPERIPPSEAVLPGPRLLVREIRVSGNTVYSTEALAKVTAPYTGRYLSAEDLEAVRQALTVYYVERGYINSGAVLPDQRVAEGVVEIQIVEGELIDIAVVGNEWLHEDYIAERLARGAGRPLNVKGLQEELQILLQGPFIRRINAELGPGDRPGEASLLAKVQPGPRYQVAAGVDNDLNPSLGTVRGVLGATMYGPLGWGDVASGTFAYAEGLRDLILDYGLPFNARDTTLNLFGRWTDSDVVEKPFKDLDIDSSQRTYSVSDK